METADDETEAARTDEAVREDEVLTAGEIVRLLDHTEAGLYRALTYTAVFSGCRHEELLALRWEEVVDL